MKIPVRGTGWRLGSFPLALAALMLLGGCATGSPRGSLTSGFGLHSRPDSFRSGSRQPDAAWAETAGGAGGFPGQDADTARLGGTPLETAPLLVVVENEELAEAPWEGRGEGSPVAPLSCGGVAVPPGWPDLSSSDEELLAPVLACSPSEFVEVQQGVDMPRLVEALDDWSAVRLGALGPVREDAAEVLNRKRASFLVQVTRERGPAEGEVFALFLIHSAFGDELGAVLRLLAGDRRLGETLGKMGAAREALARRGLNLEAYEDRPERPLEDGARGVVTALGEAFTPHEARNARATKFSAQRGHLPPPYQQALDEVERVERLRSFSPGNVALGSFDTLTFGVPLGFYHLAVGTGRGVHSLSRGQYEQAARELTPAALLVALYAGGTWVAPGAGTGGVRRLQLPELRSKLTEVVTHLEARLGGEALDELARYIQANREAGRLVSVGGPDAAVALYEARGDVAKAQVWLSRARPQQAGPTAKLRGAGKHPGAVSTLVDEPAGLTPEVVEAKLLQVELDSGGPRLSGNVAVLEKQRPSLDVPPLGAQGHPLWREYVAYWESRLAELKQGKVVKPPLSWAGYEPMRGQFARGLAFERAMVELLRADAALPKAQRRFLGDFDNPRIETYVGVKKPGTGLRFADVLIIEEGSLSGPLPRVETFSFKSRDLSLLKEGPLKAQVKADAREALRYYGETLNIRRPTLELLDKQVLVHRVRLIYEGGELKPRKPATLAAALEEAQNKVQGVEVLFQ